MKRTTLLLLMIFSVWRSVLFAQTPQELYNQALVQERAAGNLPEAIRLYERVGKDSSADRALAAQALLNAARAYEKLGQTEASRGLYREIVRAFPEQREQAAAAGQRIAETGVVQGTVARAGTGEPIAEAKVSLSGGPIDPDAFKALQGFFKVRGIEVSPPANGVADDRFMQSLADAAAAQNMGLNNPAARAVLNQFRAASDTRFSTSTDNLGHYTIRNVPPGRYTLGMERSGFFPIADTSTDNIATVAAGRTTVMDGLMSRGGVISGKVLDAAGQPLSSVRVQAYSIRYEAGFPVMAPVVSKTTDDQGDYRLFWLTPGEYLVAAAPEGSLGAVANSNIITVRQAVAPLSSSPETPPRTFYPGTPDPAMAVPVFVRGEAPASGVDIQVRNVQTFRITGEVRSNLPITAPTPPAMIEGAVSIGTRSTTAADDAGAPAIAVTLRLSGGQYVGAFELGNILPGSYTVSAWVGSQPGPAGAGAAARGVRGITQADVNVSNSDVNGVSLDIYPNAPVSGVVTVNGAAPGQTPLRVSLQPDGALGRKRVYQGLAARANLADSKTGAFTIADVFSGVYRVQIGSGLPGDLYLADVRQGGVSVFDPGFSVTRESPAPLEVILKSGARTVEGIIRDAAGKPAPRTTAVLIPPPDRRQNRALYHTGAADASGRFKIDGVAPGEYYLFAWQNMPETAYFNERFVSRNEAAGRKVSVTQNSVSGADITFIPSVGR